MIKKLKNGLDLKILINEKKEMDWITFYFKKESINLEQIIFLIMHHNEYDYNRIFSVNEDIVTTFNSGYKYNNNEYNQGWEHIRKLNFKYISHYAGRDNLANFSSIIDNSNNKILYK